jgi:ATP-dependent Clp protease ATP-binding subunit ClpA
MERMGRCARLAWEHGVEAHRNAAVARPGVTTGHLLLGVLTEDTCAGGLILGKLQLDLQLAQRTTEFVLLHGRRQSTSEERTIEWVGVAHSSAARQVLDLALEEANLYSATYPIGTEHLLLGILRVPDAMGCRILHSFGITEGRVRATRDELWQLLRSPE